MSNASNTNTTKLIKLESVLSDVYRLIDPNMGIDEDFLLESAADAFSHMVNYKLEEKVLCLRRVDNHLVTMPSVWSSVEAVLYTADSTVCENTTTQVIDTTTTDLTQENTCVCKSRLFEALKAPSLNNWMWLHNGHSLQAMSDMCDLWDVPPIGSKCDFTYSIEHGSNMMSISERTGWVIIIYKRGIYDEDGNALIPQIPLVNKAIRAHVLMEIYERRMMLDDQGSVGKFDRYFNMWERLSASAVGEMMIPDLPEWIEITKLNRYFKDDSPYRHFDNTGYEHTNIGRNSIYF